MLEDQEDVDAMLAKPLSPGDAAEAAELEDELAELMGGTATPQKPTPMPRQREPTAEPLQPQGTHWPPGLQRCGWWV